MTWGLGGANLWASFLALETGVKVLQGYCIKEGWGGVRVRVRALIFYLTTYMHTNSSSKVETDSNSTQLQQNGRLLNPVPHQQNGGQFSSMQHQQNGGHLSSTPLQQNVGQLSSTQLQQNGGQSSSTQFQQNGGPSFRSRLDFTVEPNSGHFRARSR